MKSQAFSEHIISVIREKAGWCEFSGEIAPVSGGSINRTFRIKTTSGNYFLKKNDATLYPGMFDAEARGLQLLKKTGPIQVPGVIASGTFEDRQYLILEFVEKGHPEVTFWEDFGRNMAWLHRNTSELYGWDQDNFIGSLTQENSRKEEWDDFFIQHRLEPQVSLALRHNRMNASHAQLFERLYKKSGTLFPVEKPALLHGDFWNGNFMTGQTGKAVIFDPAVYYGHREMDIGMSLLFGGFDQRFYEGYEEVCPLEKGWRERSHIANLYPLLVHVNLFGGGYVREVEQILKLIT